MSFSPPANPDIKREIKARLLAMTPRAFELFAGDLLVYIGLQNVAVTRYIGDGGIDAHGDLITDSGLVRVPTGVQVKRHRHNVQRSDIDRFIGALGGRFHHGIFITTADYAKQARVKAASSPLLRVDTVDGEQLISLMVQHDLGLQSSVSMPRLDDDYFLTFEAQAGPRTLQVREEQAAYQTGAADTLVVDVRPEDDLISLKALSYTLRVDMQTIRRGWIETNKLHPDMTQRVGAREVYFFRRDRIDDIRRQFIRDQPPSSSAEWRQEFLDFARSRKLTKSYKPVMIRAILKLVNRDGEVKIEELVQEFRKFYEQRYNTGLPAEFGVTLLKNPLVADNNQIRQLIVKNPLDRFLIQGFLEYLPQEGIVRFAPQLWSELRFYELLDIQHSVEEQINYYYSRRS